jgi:hypothetical protein
MALPLPPASLDLSSWPQPLDPFVGCKTIEWNAETKVLYLLSEPTTPVVGMGAPPVRRIVDSYNHPTNNDLARRHVLYVLLAEICYMRKDLHDIILDILISGNLPIKLEEKGYYE